MTTLTSITDDANQQMTIVLPDGTTATLTLYYRVQQKGWFYDLSWDGFSPPFQSLGNRLVTSPNVLREYRNQLTFGLTISTADAGEPVGQEDFVNGYATAILLDASDVLNIENTYFPGLAAP